MQHNYVILYICNRDIITNHKQLVQTNFEKTYMQDLVYVWIIQYVGNKYLPYIKYTFKKRLLKELDIVKEYKYLIQC